MKQNLEDPIMAIITCRMLLLQKPGDKVLKSSKIDLVLGDGKMSYEEEIGTDSIANPTEEMPNEQ